jgi:hypothetical protein
VVDAGGGRVAVEEDGLCVVDADVVVGELMGIVRLFLFPKGGGGKRVRSLTSLETTFGSNSPVLKPGLLMVAYSYGIHGHPNAARATRWPPG